MWTSKQTTAGFSSAAALGPAVSTLFIRATAQRFSLFTLSGSATLKLLLI
jgi:hypothetical protein